MAWNITSSPFDALTPLRRVRDLNGQVLRVSVYRTRCGFFQFAYSDSGRGWEINAVAGRPNAWLSQQELNWWQTEFPTRREALGALATALHAAQSATQ